MRLKLYVIRHKETKSALTMEALDGVITPLFLNRKQAETSLESVNKSLSEVSEIAEVERLKDLREPRVLVTTNCGHIAIVELEEEGEIVFQA